MAKTLLLADDSVTIQKVVGISLASEDITLVTVDNGDDALARARELRPDAILADCIMPGPSGYEVCEAIHADPALRHIPVLLLTGTFEAFDEERAVRCGAAGHIAKPFEAQTLLDEVQRLFALAASRRPAPAPPTAARPPAARTSQAEAAARPAAAEAAPRGATSPPRPAAVPPLAGRPVAPASPAPALRPAAAHPASAPARGADESFDFFEEDLEDLLPAEIAEEPALGAGRQVELDSSESPFAFGSDTEPEARGERPTALAERTVAILPAARAEEPEDEPETLGEADLAPLDADLPAPTLPAPRRTALLAEGFLDFDRAAPGAGAGDDSLLRIDGSDLAGATVLDPQGAAGFDVSAADLGAVEVPATQAPGRGAAGHRSTGWSWERERGGSRPARAAPVEPEGVGASDLELLEPEPEPPPQPDFPEDRALVVTAEPAAGPHAEVEALARSALEAVAPRLRAELHDTLEKVAWESLSDVTDRIVRQAVEHIEAIAWEVIPQMAETLIREEIRRMKSDEPAA
jgi:CheY-like chemotaxis protein